jgi:hypothetical protein
MRQDSLHENGPWSDKCLAVLVQCSINVDLPAPVIPMTAMKISSGLEIISQWNNSPS